MDTKPLPASQPPATNRSNPVKPPSSNKTLSALATSAAVIALLSFAVAMWMVSGNPDVEISRDAGSFAERLNSSDPVATESSIGQSGQPDSTVKTVKDPDAPLPAGTRRVAYKTANVQMELIVPDLTHPANAPAGTVRGDEGSGEHPYDEGVLPDR